jgi:hypothetical protein
MDGAIRGVGVMGGVEVDVVGFCVVVAGIVVVGMVVVGIVVVVAMLVVVGSVDGDVDGAVDTGVDGGVIMETVCIAESKLVEFIFDDPGCELDTIVTKLRSRKSIEISMPAL